MCSKVRADKGDAAAVEGEGDSDCALVAAHAQHATRHAGSAHLANVLLPQHILLSFMKTQSRQVTSRCALPTGLTKQTNMGHFACRLCDLGNPCKQNGL